jgi:uncharacterized protein YihD (DUF1040 family)
VKLNDNQKRRLNEIKKKLGEKWNKQDHKNIITIMKYLSPKCMYTGNASELEKVIIKYSLGYKTSGELLQDIKHLKRLYDIGGKE